VTTSAESLRAALNLSDAFKVACAAVPDHVAVLDQGSAITYSALAARVDTLAAAVACELEVRPPSPGTRPVVAIRLEPGVDTVCALLAVLAAGAAYLPVDPAAPEDYVADLLGQAAAQLVIGRGAQHGDSVTDLQGLLRSRSPVLPRPDPVEPGDTAYVVFTSGSTGRPKGVLLSHRAMLHSTAARVHAHGVPGRVPLLHSPSVDVYSGVVFWALLTGATLVIGRGGLADLPATAALLAQQEITDLVYLASLYPLLLDHLDAEQVPALRRVLIGSDRWGESVVDRHVALLPHVSLHNEYGPTEAAVWTSQACVWDAATGSREPVTIGTPVPGTGYHLLDPQQRAVQPGGHGELVITGAQLASGYTGPARDAEARFVVLPDGQRGFRTGDRATRTEQGQYVFTGRLDRQLKLAGHRIEPGQVETVLMAHPAVGLAHVVARHVRGPGAVLIAYLTPRSGRTVAVGQVKAAAASRLPAHMVPSCWVVLPGLPRTLGGKIDEAALPDPPDNSPQHPVSASTSAVDTEDVVLSSLTGLLAEVLECPAPGPDQVLADVGISSLGLMQFAARITRTHGVVVPLSVLASGLTLAEAAGTVRAAARTTRPSLLPVAHDAGGSPLSAQQRQVWLLNHVAPDAVAYSTQSTLLLAGTLDVAALAEALSCVVARQEILRTTVHEHDGDPVQVVHPPWQVHLPVHDLTTMPQDQRGAALDREVARHTGEAFDTTALPLVRWRLYRLGESSWALLQVEHHFVHDGWTAVQLQAQIAEAYACYATGRVPRCSALPVCYRDFVSWQRAWLDSADAAAHRAHWAGELAGIAAHGVSFTPDRPRPAQQRFRGARVDAEVPAAVVDALDIVAARRGISRFAVFLAAFVLLARQHTERDDITVGTALANRCHPDLEPLLGMFVNALPLRLTIGPDDTVAEVLDHTMAVLSRARDHQEFPLVEIINDLRLPREAARNPLFSLMFAFHDTPRPAFDAAGLTGVVRIEHNRSAKNDVNVVCVPRPPRAGSAASHDGMTVLWEYDTDLFTQDTATAVLAAYTRVLDTLTDPQTLSQPATALTTVDPRHADWVLRTGAGMRIAAEHATLHGGLEATIRRHPQRSALVHAGRHLTYQDLDSAASVIAASLHDRGVVAGARVAVACGPGAEHVAACLAVLRRGATLVCLDPTEPAARLSTILSDADVAVAVCTPATAAALAGIDDALPRVMALLDTHADTSVPPVAVRGQDTAYLVYTSGATGSPKAVAATHTNAVTALTARTARAGTARARTLITLPLQFDVALSMIFWTLGRGGTVVFPDATDPDQDPRDPAAVRAMIDAHRITHVNFVATYYQQFLSTVPPGWTPTLRMVAIGGEPCTPNLVHRHAQLFPNLVLDNEYGPTEASVWCTAARAHAPGQTTTGLSGVVTVGAPLPNYRLYVLSPSLQLRPAGARGELCVAGDGVVTGYWRRPALTAARFCTPDTGPLAGVRLYRTGDDARLLPSGEIQLLGRQDDQIKIRGYRVEPGEVARCLTDHRAVSAAHVLAEHGPDTAPGAQVRLIAYVAASRAATLGDQLADQLRAHVRSHLPAAMVPASVIVLDALPLTATGKVDRAALPPPTQDDTIAPDGSSGLQPTATTATLATLRPQMLRVWSSVLQRAVGAGDSWFGLGGDSLTAIRAAGQLRHHGIDVTVGQLLRAGTVDELIAELASAHHSTRDAAETASHPRRRAGTPVALSAIQHWFFSQHFAEPDHFNQARLFTVAGNPPAEKVRTALTAVLARHDAFRTRFDHTTTTGWTARLIDDLPTLDLPEHTVAADAAGPDPSELTRLHQSLSITGRLHTAALFTDPVGPRSWVFLVAHHLIVDTVSWQVLGDDLTHALSDPDTPLSPAPAAEHTPRPPDVADTAYWARLAATAPPAGPPRPRAAYGDLIHHEATLSRQATAYLLDLARRRTVTVLSMLLAATQHAVGPALTPGASHPGGLYTFLESHGRDAYPHSEQTVGWLTSLYPVLLTAPGQPEHATLLSSAAHIDRQLAAVPAGGTGYGQTRYLAPDSPAGALLASAATPELTVNYLGQRGGHGHSRLTGAALPTGTAIGARNVLPTAVHLSAVIEEGALRLHSTCDPHRLAPSVIEAACASILQELQHLAQLTPVTSRPAVAGATRHFLVHPVDGQVHHYAPLVDALGPTWDCHGLRADNPTATGVLRQSPAASATTVGAVAAAYLQRIRRRQPEGPYTLTGWSFGAVIAYEMARQLEQSGQQVRHLVLLDPPAPHPAPDPVIALSAHVHALLPDLSPRQVHAAVHAALASPPPDQITVLRHRLGMTDGQRDDPLDQLSILLAHHRMLARWAPNDTVSTMDLVRPAVVAAGIIDPWPAHGRHVRCHVVPGDHHTMMRDPVALTLLASLYPGTDLDATARP
jgi:amino acid adenylation domain-containing protein/non-ribosomal peptide synthase protein (TIGR01720 family)